MLLKCMTREKATRKNALQVGDAASIHFWDRGTPGRSDKVPGQIVRVDENLIAMEYAPTAAQSAGKLITLLQRKEQDTSPEKGPMKDKPIPKLQPNLKLPDKDAADTRETAPPRDRPAAPVERSREQSPGGSSALQLGLLLLAVLGVLGLALYSFSLSSRVQELTQVVNELKTNEINQNELTLPPDLIERIAALEQKQADMTTLLGDTVKQSDLTTAVEEFDSKLQQLQAKPQVSATTQSAPAGSTESTAAAGQSWVVNLATLSDNDAVEKFIQQANSAGLDVKAEQVAVNDKQMYRLSIPGVASFAEAKILAETAQKQLGLSQKPWIAKQ